MKDKLEILEDITKSFDLDRIRNLPVPEKFKLAEYTKFIYREATFASENGALKLDQSDSYTADRTYCLFAMLVVNGTEYRLLKEIVLNYATNFEHSDIFSGKIVVLGIGVLLMERGFAADAIANFLLQILGDDFLLNNLHYPGYLKPETSDKLSLETTIAYKAFDASFRKIKYDLLAFIHLSKTEGVEYVKDLINNSYGNRELSFYFNMLNVSCPDTLEYIYGNLKSDSKTYSMDHLLISGAYAILTDKNVFDSHYLFNSIIGKYSRYDKDSNEIESEIKVRLEEIIKK